ncbi:hypothetical protein PsYK624_081160 [Phanerochaete sordida]|uniref:Uncharacterized protein n=1 Tax=Phanerochaete sordida TaxID=48140 RepID=A0A9P3GCQ9_9APHY|nr:hypothetical protein PsYK624_081160 [Phanerochaete sordida]
MAMKTSAHTRTRYFHLNLSQIPAMSLCPLTVTVVYDTVCTDSIVDVWTAILAVLRSVPEATLLARVTLTSLVPLAVLRSS